MTFKKHDHIKPAQAEKCAHVYMTFCFQCDIPYCKSCGREWYNECNLPHYYFYPSWGTTTTTVSPDTVTVYHQNC